MRKITFTVALALVLSMVSAAPALGAEVGASGQCYDDDDHEQGGQGSVSVDSDGNVDAVDAAEAQSIAAAFGNFGNDAVEDGPSDDGCDNPDDDDPNQKGEEDPDYIEAHASAEGESVQVCYHNGPNPNQTEPADFHAGQGTPCPTHPEE